MQDLYTRCEFAYKSVDCEKLQVNKGKQEPKSLLSHQRTSIPSKVLPASLERRRDCIINDAVRHYSY